MALRDWMTTQGWDDVFLDIDPERGLVSGERWEAALRKAASRCEIVIFVISRAWLGSQWCRDEFNLARHLNKRLFGVLIEDIPKRELPPTMTREWQLTDLANGKVHTTLKVTPPPAAETREVSFSDDGLNRLRIGLLQAGLDPKYFKWPPDHDPERAPYRGLLPLEADDAGIFFGREGPTVVGLDTLRGLRQAAPPRILVILGASGAGKSSFMRAGLLPRLAREDRHFLCMPVIRPERAVLSGETGLITSLDKALSEAERARPRAEVRAAIDGGAEGVAGLLQEIVDAHAARIWAGEDTPPKPPTLIVPIDQGEELFTQGGDQEASAFLQILRDLCGSETLDVVGLITIRSDNYEPLQTSAILEDVRQHTLSLAPMPKGAYANVIEGPARRLAGTKRALVVEEPLVQELLSDIEEDDAKDALPLLAFTLERLYQEFHGAGRLTVDHYRSLGRIRGSIEAAVERALKAADGDPNLPKDRQARLALMRRAMIPWLANLDPETGTPRRRVAYLSELPAEARPMVDLLVDQRLLAKDTVEVSKEGSDEKTRETTIEPAHEALLRQWDLLSGWLNEDAGQLTVIDSVKRAAKTWQDNKRGRAWIAHRGANLVAAERLRKRSDLAQALGERDWRYLRACRNRVRRGQAITALAMSTVIGIGWLVYEGHLTRDKVAALASQTQRYADNALHTVQNMTKDLTTPGTVFRDCSTCPEMVVVPAGSFMMGSPETEEDRDRDEGPQRKVTIAQPFAVGKFEMTFDEWQACVAGGGCQKNQSPSDRGWGTERRPVINVSWDHAQEYLKWLSGKTGKTYRLLTEAEWEYAARAGTTTRYSWGDDVGKGNANCNGCGSQWDKKQTAPVGSFKANAFGLHDMHGNVWEWVEDCHGDYKDAPTDGTKAPDRVGCNRVYRGGSCYDLPGDLRAATRYGLRPENGDYDMGFRAARTLPHIP